MYLTGSLDDRFATAMGGLLGPDFPSDIGLAVSGGGDSMAMLTLAHNWTRVWGVRLWVVTVDHGLRPDSAAEATMVADECSVLGHPHATVRWHWNRTGNLQDAARRGRREAIDRWRGTLRHVLMAHTRDDVAETFLMRLARGSGVDGLSAMSAKQAVIHTGPRVLQEDEYDGALPPHGFPNKGVQARHGTFHIVRPCLDMGREELRHYLRTLKGRWVEDPSNEDQRFDRVRMRTALAVLTEAGLSADTLAATAHRLSRARASLRARAVEIWREIGTEERGDILFERDGFAGTDADTQLRLLAAALQFVSGAEYRPRAAPLDALLERLLSGGGGTLHGCEARMERAQIRVFREYAAVKDMVLPVGAQSFWDGRWAVSIGEPNGPLAIRALGEDGWAQIAPENRTHPHAAARSLPAIWRDETLISCPLLEYGAPARAHLRPMGRDTFRFHTFLDSH